MANLVNRALQLTRTAGSGLVVLRCPPPGGESHVGLRGAGVAEGRQPPTPPTQLRPPLLPQLGTVTPHSITAPRPPRTVPSARPQCPRRLALCPSRHTTRCSSKTRARLSSVCSWGCRTPQNENTFCTMLTTCACVCLLFSGHRCLCLSLRLLLRNTQQQRGGEKPAVSHAGAARGRRGVSQARCARCSP